MSAYAGFKATTASEAASSASGPASAADAAGASATRALLHQRLDALMAAAAAALPPALRTAAVAQRDGSAARQVVQAIGSFEDRQLVGQQEQGVVLQQRGVEPPVFLGPLLYADGAPSSSAALSAKASGVQLRTAAPVVPVTHSSAAINPRKVVFTGAVAQQQAAGLAGPAKNSTSQQRLPSAGKENESRWMLFEARVQEAGRSGRSGPGLLGTKAGFSESADADAVPLLFATPAPAVASAVTAATDAATAVKSTIGRTVVRGGLFDTPAGMPAGAGATLWGKTPAGFDVSELEFEKHVRFATPQPKAAAAAAAGAGGVLKYTGPPSHKRMRKTPI